MLVLGAAVGSAYAQASDPIERRGLHSDRSYFSAAPFEQIDTVTGNLVLSFTDLVLPGKAGHALRFERVYNSNRSIFDASHWRFGFPGMVMSIIERPQPWEGIPDPNDDMRAIKSTTPTFVMADGSERSTAYIEKFEDLIERTYLNVRSAQFHEYQRRERTLRMTDGTVARYEPDGTMRGNRPVLRLKNFVDPFGNTVTLDYDEYSDCAPGPLRGIRVTQSVGSDARQIMLCLNADGTPRLMKYAGRAWEYTYVASGDGAQDIDTVTLPEGLSWDFDYDVELTNVTLPTGGRIEYEYAPRWIYDLGHQGDPNHGEEIRTLSGRRTYDGTTLTGTWALTTGPLIRDLPNSSGTVTTPSGVVIDYASDGVTNPGKVLEGGVGISIRTVYRAAGGYIEKDHRTFEVIKSVDYGGNIWWGSAELKSRTITRRSSTGSQRSYTTTYSYRSTNFGDYHHPYNVTETGDQDQTRTTTVNYWYSSAGLFQVGKPAQKWVSIGDQSTHYAWQYRDADGFLLSETAEDVTTEYLPFEENGFGNVQSQRTKNGTEFSNEISYEYQHGQVSKISTNMHTTVREINSDGTVRSQKQAGRETTFEYDGLMRVTKTQPPGSNAHVTTYTQRGVKNERGSSWTTTNLDGFGRAVGTLNSRGIQTVIDYDEDGRQQFASLPFASGSPSGVRFCYDELDRVVHEDYLQRSQVNDVACGSAARSRSYVYDDVNQNLTARDENDNDTISVFNAFGHPDDRRLVQLHDAAGNGWHYDYNVLGRVTQMSGPNNVTRTWNYFAGTSRLQSETHPESGTTSYTYYGDGKLKTRTDADGTQLAYDYDDSDRLSRISGSGSTTGTQTTTITYESGSDNRKTVTVGDVATEFVYELATGRLASRIDRVDDEEFRIGYSYDGNDNLFRLTYPSGRVVEYEYQSEDQITRVLNPQTTPSVAYADEFLYHPSGALKEFRAGNDTRTTIAYEPLTDWVKSIKSGPLDLTYENYDGVGNVGKITDNTRSAYTLEFRYDELNRLTSYGGPGQISGQPTYDAHGNRTDGTFTYDPQNRFRLKSFGAPVPVTMTYYNNGNLQDIGPQSSYTYTPNNLLKQAALGNSTSTYAYDADEWRVKKTVGEETTYYLRGPNGQLLTEWKNECPQATVKDYVYAGSRPIAFVTAKMPQDEEECGPVASDTLRSGESLAPDQIRRSQNGRFTLIYQLDGNLVLKDGEQPKWWTETENTPPGSVIMQGDGHLLVKDGNDTIRWRSCTDGHHGARLVVENSGRLVIYSSENAVLWDSSTHPNGLCPAPAGEEPPPASAIASFRAASWFFLSARGGGGSGVYGDGLNGGGAQEFTLADINGSDLQSGDYVYLRTVENPHYVVATSGGGPGQMLNADSATAGPSQKFQIVRVGGAGPVASGDAVRIVTKNGFNVRADDLGHVKADGTNPQSSAEQFTIWLH